MVTLRRRRILYRAGLSVAAIAALVGGVLLYRHYTQWESTDDAQVDGYIYPITSRVSGYVQHVMVDDNDVVHAGDVLVQLDVKDYEVAVANAHAANARQEADAVATSLNVPLTSVNTSSQLSTAQSDIEHAQAGLMAAQEELVAARASLSQAEANDVKAQDDVERYGPLASKDEIPQQQFTQAVAQAHARLEQAEATLKYAETRPQQISLQESRAKAARAQVEQAAAELHQATLNLHYTTIVAPVAGIVGRRSVQAGEYLAAGQELMSIVPLDSANIWITANFKETQLTQMRPGQPVRVSVDSYGREYAGHVASIAAATGARYSLLPPENATGNYVKVVQRIPVKIFLDKGQDPDHLLRIGMSVEPAVKIR